jgi:hypothetical protein
VLLPHLAGTRLKQELDGLGHLCAGALELLQPLQVDAPGQVLKSLVLIGMLLERLENAIPNPAAAGRVPRKKASGRRTGTGKAKRKTVRRGATRKAAKRKK